VELNGAPKRRIFASRRGEFDTHGNIPGTQAEGDAVRRKNSLGRIGDQEKRLLPAFSACAGTAMSKRFFTERVRRQQVSGLVS